MSATALKDLETATDNLYVNGVFQNLKPLLIAWHTAFKAFQSAEPKTDEELERASDLTEKVMRDLKIARTAAPPAAGRRKTRRFKMPRLMSRKYCKKTPCRRMGFTQRASCRPYKNCFNK